MPIYVVVEIQVTDPETYETVKQLTPATVAAYGGRYLARGGQTECIHGSWDPKRLVILEFETLEQVKAWQESPEYRPIKALRDRSSQVNMVAIESTPPQED
ncbi:MAG: DUF1330 domain-containing protein [Anaerolineaceae bacterium]|nr:DUF1330 domain-containing protein [Anaerolineaceae bacterium]